MDIASSSPIERTNLLYSLHFYAATHKEDLQSKLQTAPTNGLPVFVSEFGITEASGSGIVDTTSADTWMKLLMKTALATFTGIFQTKTKPVPFFVPRAHHYPTGLFDDYSPAGQWFLQNQQNNASIYNKAAAAPTAAVDTPTTLYASDDYWSFSNGCKCFCKPY